MAVVCDLCNNSAKLHICDKCYNIAKHLLEMYEENRLLGIDKPKPKKRGRPKKTVESPSPKRRGRPKKLMASPPSEEERSKDPLLSKCWTCSFGFISAGHKVACAEQKEPATCGQK